RLAREEPEQGALPRAVRADEGDLVPRVEEEVRVLEDERSAPGFPEVAARDDGLHVLGASLWSPMRLRSALGWATAMCDDPYMLLHRAECETPAIWNARRGIGLTSPEAAAEIPLMWETPRPPQLGEMPRRVLGQGNHNIQRLMRRESRSLA